MRRFLTLLATATLGLTVAGIFAAGPAYADSAHASLDASCAAGQVMTGGTFTLTGVTEDQTITVNPVTSGPIGHATFVGGTATYNVTFTQPLGTPPAQATVPNEWAGSFALTSAHCVAAKPATVTGAATTCGTPHLIVKVTNPNPVMVTYKIEVTGLTPQTTKLAAGEGEEVSFTPITAQVYNLTVTGAGVKTEMQITVNPCGYVAPGPGSNPTTKAPKAQGVGKSAPSAAAASQSAWASPSAAGTPAISENRWSIPWREVVLSSGGILIVLGIVLAAWLIHRRRKSRPAAPAP